MKKHKTSTQYSEIIARLNAGEYDCYSVPVAFDRVLADIAIGIADVPDVARLRSGVDHWDGRIDRGSVRISRLRDCLDKAFARIAILSGRNSRQHMPSVAKKKEQACCAMTRLAGIGAAASFVRAVRGCVEEWAPDFSRYAGGVLPGKYPSSRQNAWQSRPSGRDLKRKQEIRRKLGL